MAVNLVPPAPGSLHPVSGVELGFAEAGIRKAARRDLMLMRFAPGAVVSGVFTRNSFAAAPVLVCREHLAAGHEFRGIVVNAGNANCGTGSPGLQAARATCEIAARLLGCTPDQVLPFSTGVILEHLPMDKIEQGLPACAATLAADHWVEAASAIMTTDTVPKGASVQTSIDGRTVTVTGIAKGVGMLQPDMATMLAFVATDAVVAKPALDRLVREIADQSFNRVTVDGDTSTNDSFVLIATGQAGGAPIDAENTPAYRTLRDALLRVCAPLAQAIARDGEGATKFITVQVTGGRDEAEALRVARSIANSPLVKTAFFASDPNLGRLLMAIGNAGVDDLDTSRVSLHLGDVQVIDRGGRAATYREEDGVRVMQPEEITITVDLGRGPAHTVVWTCDFSYDYVKINAEYRT